MINLKNYFNNLTEKNGIFFSEIESKISYPEDGNESCFQVENDSFWFRHRNNCIAAGIIKYCPNSVFFDIGGGNGFVAKGLEDMGITTVLVEPGIIGCTNAKKRNLNNIVCSTLENASFQSNTLPAVGLFDVVEHIEQDVDFLFNIKKLLIDDGFVFITVPAFQSLWSNEDIEAGHFRRYTRKELEKKLKSVGFVIEYSSYIFSILVLPVFMFRVFPFLLGLNKKTKGIEKYKNDHKPKSGIIDKILSVFWKFELTRIRSGKIIGIGGSCFIIARKVKTR
jgi:2-polyprenyl-3-methyl-5-hydroxy-6-metoxy-1,4-benzoquinol methylase